MSAAPVSEVPEQGELAVGRAGRRTAKRGSAPAPRTAPPLAAERPVATLALDVGLSHLDRDFDYAVPATLADTAQPGVRVRVRFAGRMVDGFVLDRREESAHEGRLQPLVKVVSPEPVLTTEIAGLVRAVADRYAGMRSDVLRLAVPPRHGRAESSVADPPVVEPLSPPHPGGWTDYAGGAAFVAALAGGRAPRAVWQAVPDQGWVTQIATAVAATVSAGRGALVVVPDARDLDRVGSAVQNLVGEERTVLLSAELGPAERYRRWLAVRRGHAPVVVGTRAAMFAPVGDPGLYVVWDDGDDLHAEPRAPYPHVREVLALRAARESAALLVGGFSRTTEGEALVRSGWAQSLAAPREVVRAHAPLVELADSDEALAEDAAARAARLPTTAWRVARDGLTRGPVLVQVPRRGYLPGLACADCRTPARCAACHGPVMRGAGGAPACRWCARPAEGWTCSACGRSRLRATQVGATRTAEELGRAFPGVAVRHSAADAPAGVLARVPASPALVVATPGAEPVAAGGYAAALLLDGWALLGRPDLRAGEETLRRWLAATALVCPRADGGRVLVVAEPTARPTQALLRLDPATYAGQELDDRAALHLPPAAAVASLTGEPTALRELLDSLELPPGAELLGPAAVAPAGGPTSGATDQQRYVVRVPRVSGRTLAEALRAAAAVRSAHKLAPVRVQLDPLELG